MDPATLARHALEALKRPLTLKEALSSVADFRIDRRKKFPLYEILMIAVCAMIDGAKGPAFGVASLRSVSAASVQQFSVQWEADGSPLPTGRWPLAAPLIDIAFGDSSLRSSGDTVVGTLRPQAASKSAWLESIADVTGDVISIDGKLLRRALTTDCKMPCIVSAHSHRTRLVIGQVKADEKSNEITAIPSLLDVLCLKGAIVTIDAAGCQKKIVRKILKRGAGYIISLKGNLEASLRSEVSQQPASSNSASSGKRTGALSPLVAGHWLHP